jgi:FkbM family methyltransferase
MNKRSYCPDFLDLKLVDFFKHKFGIEQGTFVDIGANDGITGSNSMLLEEKGWKGLLIEPNHKHAEALSKRTGSKVFFIAISESPSVDFHVVDGPKNLHGLSRIQSSDIFREKIEKEGGQIVKLVLPAKRLTVLLDENQVNREFELLSIDTEGHELVVLKTLDFQFYQPKMIIVEDNSKGSNSTIDRYLSSKKYRRVSRIGVNEIYVHQIYFHFFWKEALFCKLLYFRWSIKRLIYALFGLKPRNPYY